MRCRRFTSQATRRSVWSVARAAAYGGCIGAVAALFKTLGPLHGPFAASKHASDLLENVPEIVGAALGFALLCAGA